MCLSKPHFYNAQPKLIESTCYFNSNYEPSSDKSNTGFKSTSFYNHVKDANGRVISESHFVNGKLTTEERFTYDNFGNEISSTKRDYLMLNENCMPDDKECWYIKQTM